jgi:hypothetical protein
MYDHVIRISATAVAVMLLLGGCGTPFVLTPIALVAGNNETLSVITTGMPTSMALLKWTDWRPVDGSVRPYDGHLDHRNLNAAHIVAYRIGKAHGPLTQMTFYQARYLANDGSQFIAPASGQLPLVSPWFPGLISITLLQLCASALLFRWVVRRNRQATINGKLVQEGPSSGP